VAKETPAVLELAQPELVVSVLFLVAPAVRVLAVLAALELLLVSLVVLVATTRPLELPQEPTVPLARPLLLLLEV
jgi:hypothetical protein